MKRIYEEGDFIDLADFLESADVDEIGRMLRFAAKRISDLEHEVAENRKWNSECPECRDRRKDVSYAIDRLKEIQSLTNFSTAIYDNAGAALLVLNKASVKVTAHGGQ